MFDSVGGERIPNYRDPEAHAQGVSLSVNSPSGRQDESVIAEGISTACKVWFLFRE